MNTPFWETKKLHQMTGTEWEGLCDGCAKCYVHKLEDEATGEIHYTCVACRMLDIETCRCIDYSRRHKLVPDCAVLSADYPENFHWMPETCAYRLLHEGKPLPVWHPLITGDPALQQIQRTFRLVAQIAHDVCVDHRRFHVPVPKQLLNLADISLRHQKMGGKAVSQRMHRYMLVDFSGLHSLLQRGLHNLFAYMMTSRLA